MIRKRWQIKKISSRAETLSKKYNLSTPLVQILLNRNVKEEDFLSFLNPSTTSITSAYSLPDMDKAVRRIHRAIKNKEGILLAGDYDVDGITSLTIFYEFIKKYPKLFSFFIPHRIKDGYGLSERAIQKAKEKGCKLIITFDCGTNAQEQIHLAKKISIDTIVVDHHLPKRENKSAFALINPKLQKKDTPYYYLSSAALSFKLVQALDQEVSLKGLDMVALSLVCDIVPLWGENRILLKEGLKHIQNTQRPAIKALCQVGKINQKAIDTFHLGYVLGPRLNASGRMSSAVDSLKILLTESEEEAILIAKKLQAHNQQRKITEKEMIKEAEELLEDDTNNIIVVHKENWHQGVLGIVASRLVDKYQKPALVISFNEELGHGSGRSVNNIHLEEILNKCSGHLHSFGGHSKACGLSLWKKDLLPFKEKIYQIANREIPSSELIPTLEIDAPLKFSNINLNFLEELDKLKPYGEGNSRPLFITTAVVKKTSLNKKNNFYSLWLESEGITLEGIIYDKDLADIINYGRSFDIVYHLDKNYYYNQPKLIIQDCRLLS